MAINIYLDGSPGGRFKIFLGKIIIYYKILEIFNFKIFVHIAGVIILQKPSLLNKLKKINAKIICYQHGGGAGMDIDDQFEINV